MSRTYAQYVRLGRTCLARVRCHQVMVAYYATRVCEIREGGGGAPRYGLSQYATSLGMSPKLLSRWVIVYRTVIERLGMDTKAVTPTIWTAAQRVTSILKSEARLVNAEEGTPGVRRRKQAPVRRIRTLLKDNLSAASPQAQVYVWTETVIGIRNRVAQGHTEGASRGSVEHLRDQLNLASSAVTNCLGGR